jgi:thiopeptide-type bacteriocin biosynthesis protein
MSGLRASGFFVVRSSLLPYDSFLAFAKKETKEELRASLREWLSDPAVREALFLASPSLEESLPHWEREPTSERGQKVELSLVKYLSRMSSRATPFGLFAGVALGEVSEKSSLSLAPRSENARVTRLDGELLASLSELLVKEERAKLRFEPNSSLYEAAGRLRFAAPRKTDEGRSYDLVAIEPTPHLEAALEAAKGGATLEEIGRAVARAADVSPEEGTEFASRLLEKRVLEAELEPLVTGDEPLDGLLLPLERVNPERAKPVEQLRAELRALDERGLGTPPERYRELAKTIESLGAPFELPRLFQVDMVKRGALTLSKEVVEEIQRGVLLAHRLTPASPNEDLERFRQAFQERWEGQAIPLAQALDEESGVGLGAASASEPLLKGLALPARGEGSLSFLQRDGFLLEKLFTHEDGELVLTEDDLKALEPRGERPPLPYALAAVLTLAAKDEAALDRGDFTYHLGSAIGPSGATLLGRFAHTDRALKERIREHLRAEEAAQPDALFAEVVHLPEGRLGNVIFRPVLRGHEIPFLGRSGGGEKIPIGDLVVSVEAGRIVLRSRALGKEIVPRITCSFNIEHRSSQPIHRFLGALQGQGVSSSLGFTWGALSGAPRLPRVRSGKCVLALARWNVSARAFEPVKKAKREERAAALRSLRERLAIPRTVALTDYDNVLPIDFENSLSQDAFFQLVKDRPGGFQLTELWPAPEELCLRGPEGRFHHELFLPLTREKEPSSGETPPPTPFLTSSARRFAPGSEWIFFKLYTGQGTLDHVLRTLVPALVKEARERGLAERWFFLRYADPRPHLRLRFQGPRASELFQLLYEKTRPLLEEGRLASVQLDTYERELERYGGEEGVSLAEKVFEADSECALSVIAETPGDPGADQRWRLLVRGVDQLLNDLGLDVKEKRAFAKREKEGYGAELGAEDAFWRQLGARFRKERGSLEALLDRSKDEASPKKRALAAFAARSARIAPLVPQLRSLPVPLSSLASSYVHMHANRLLKSAPRAQEACLHYFLERLYEAEIARAK